MRVSAKKSFQIVLLMAVLVMSSYGLADEQSQDDQTSSAKQELLLAAPDMAKIIPLATELFIRLAVLENEVPDLLDITAVEKEYAKIEENIKDPVAQLQRLKDTKYYRYSRLIKLKQVLKEEYELFEKTCEPLTKAIHQLGAWREKWQAEKERWNQWQSSLLKEQAPDQIKSTFTKANDITDTALKLILEHLEVMLAIQAKAGNIQAKISDLTAELDGLILARQRGDIAYKSHPMFSGQYFSQFSSELWYAARRNLYEISWSGDRFFAQHGWVVVLHGFLSLAVIVVLYRKHEVLKGSKSWRFLIARPFSAGLFLGVTTIWPFYQYVEVPAIYELVLRIVAGISFARLSYTLIEVSWKRQFVYWLIIVFIVTKLMNVISLPLLLFQLYMVLTALVSIIFCLWWTMKSHRNKDSIFYTWSLRLLSSFFIFIIVAEIWGKEGLVEYLFVSLIRSIAIVFIFVLFTHMVNGGLEWLLHTSPFRIVAAQDGNTNAIMHRVVLLIGIIIWGLVVLPAIIMTWGFSDTIYEATKDLLALGFNLGSHHISIGLLIASAGIIYGAFLASWSLQRLLTSKVFIRYQVENGVRLSIGKLVHYILISIGFLLAISTLGFELTKLTIILSALGIGIGFGLQSIVNNFVSGFILLFEQSIRVGDTLEIEDKWVRIKKIGLRATIVRTTGNADLIIPNSDLVTNEVTNWTLSNRQVRLKIKVRVVHGSNVPLVMETLLACGKANSRVVQTPEPQVRFRSFGDSSLNFELRVRLVDAKYRSRAESELNQAIDRSFREAKIELALPQRDLHLRSMDESITFQPPETSE